MKKTLLLAFFVALITSCTSANEENYLVDNRTTLSEGMSQYNSVLRQLESEYSKNLMYKLDNVRGADVENKVYDRLSDMTDEELLSLKLSFSSKDLAEKTESLQEQTMLMLFKTYGENSYRELEHYLDMYLDNGGHNLSNVNYLASLVSPNLRPIFLSICAIADATISKNAVERFVLENEQNTRAYIIPGGPDVPGIPGTQEYYCRQKLWMSVKHLLLQSGIEIGVGTIMGIPELDTIVAFDGIVDISMYIYEYHACVRYAIP